ncbi:hypothetical protein PHAMO_200052 [Magnetospirillum molischianum DSM 120]|uniref:Uncharacterized protein n=1 Tax=Magnetospirillum molischianum DSM 120 TaxID=1150626 RepID=H8FQ29_MAGML|nr:hypothetical protein PHAMO_200052 [Magnetospirillum molischianum DSM 120]
MLSGDLLPFCAFGITYSEIFCPRQKMLTAANRSVMIRSLNNGNENLVRIERVEIKFNFLCSFLIGVTVARLL